MAPSTPDISKESRGGEQKLGLCWGRGGRYYNSSCTHALNPAFSPAYALSGQILDQEALTTEKKGSKSLFPFQQS